MIQENIGFQIAYFLSKHKRDYIDKALAVYLLFGYKTLFLTFQRA
jgi:hypothetical protein